LRIFAKAIVIMPENPQLHQLQTRRTARYYTLGEAGPQTRWLWIALHGYGQLAAYFIRHFETIADDECLIAAPEGLSRFYLEGFEGRVGATWMTREGREDEIADQAAYLDKLAHSLRRQCPEGTRLCVLGFSQGVATAWRWLMNGRTAPDAVVLWAGKSPEEQNARLLRRLHNIPCFVAAGDADPFITPERLQNERKRLESLRPGWQFCPFEGAHSLDAGVLQAIKQQLQG